MADIVANHRNDPEKYACKDRKGNPLTDPKDVDDPTWKLKQDSPWYTDDADEMDQGFDCIWPVDHDDGRFCSPDDEDSGFFNGIHKCHAVAVLRRDPS